MSQAQALWQPSGRPCRNARTAWRTESCSASGACQSVRTAIADSRTRSADTGPAVTSAPGGADLAWLTRLRWLLGVPDRHRAQRFPVRRQVEVRRAPPRGENRRSDPATAHPAGGQGDEQTLDGGSTATVNMRCARPPSGSHPVAAVRRRARQMESPLPVRHTGSGPADPSFHGVRRHTVAERSARHASVIASRALPAGPGRPATRTGPAGCGAAPVR